MTYLINKIKGKWLVLIFTYLVFIIVLIYSTHTSIHSINQSEQIKSRLTTIQQELHGYINDITKPNNPIDIDSLKQEIQKIGITVSKLKTPGDDKLSRLLTENQIEINQKLDSIHKIISSLSNKQHSIQYLPLSVLPFQVVSLDSIQQVSVATVRYDFKTIPLEKEDKLAGWKLIDLDFGKQTLSFQNSNKEQVLVQLGKKSGSKHA